MQVCKKLQKTFWRQLIRSKDFFLTKNLNDLIFEKSDQLLDLGGLDLG